MGDVNHDPRLDRLVNRLYDAALDERLWSGLAVEIASAFDSTSTVVKTHGIHDQVQLLEVTDNMIVAPKDQAWADHWQHNDLWVQRSVAFGMSRVVTNLDLIAPAEFEKTGYYQDWLRHLDIYHLVGAAFPVDQNTVGVLGIHRVKSAGAYAEQDRERVARFLPHLSRTLRIRQRLQHASLEQCTMLDALARLDSAIVVVDAFCRVLHTNRRAERMLSVETNIRVHRGRLCLSDPARNATLARLVQEAVRTAAGMPEAPSSALAIGRPGRLPITALITPLRATWDRTGTCPRPHWFLCGIQRMPRRHRTRCANCSA
jgi:hypothetical protein